MSAPVARIDTDALRHNLRRARASAPRSNLMAVIKADAYGHGMVEVAAALDEADAFAVARVEEGIALRDAGVDKRVLILGGVNTEAEAKAALQAGLETTLHHRDQLAVLAEALHDSPRGIRCWLKLDSGMHRLGIQAEQAGAVLESMRAIPGIVPSGVMTHLANADDRADAATLRQLKRFADAAAPLELETSVGNSAAILGWPQAQGDWVRPGIMLYGASPFIDSGAAEEGLRPVMTLSARLIAINEHRAGDAIGYGGSWRCPEDMRIGVAAIGYGDGYPRHAPSGTPVLVDGARASLVGRVSMDTLTLDLRPVPDARIGDSVVLWGDGLPVEEIAQAAGTITYELFCRLTRRVRFEYVAAGGAAT